MKNEITTTHQRDIKWDIDGMTIPQAIELLQEWLDDYGSEAKLDLYKEDYEDYEHQLRIISVRQETDQETEIRVNKAQKEFLDKQRRQEEADLKAYEQLAKKLGKA